MIRALAAVILASGLLTPPANAAKRALLIGISQYRAGIGSLEGPQNDVQSLHRALVDHWGFEEAGVRILINQAATREAILAAFDTLASQAESNDSIFIFFSGHGTSWYAPGRADMELDPSTGAIVSSDGRLIFGNRDLQPRLHRIDTRANAFIVFDSCYSGSAVKSVFLGAAKYTDPETLTRNVPQSAGSFDEAAKNSFGALTIREQPFPYSNLIYLSAASKSEIAIDIPRSLIASGRYHTVDGLPHGALTDAVIAGLTGAADTNHDSRITYGELYQYVRQRVNREWNQTPQLLYSSSKGSMLDDPVFATASSSQPQPAQQTQSTGVRVRIEGKDQAVSTGLSNLPGVTLSQDSFDLLIRPTADGWDLFHASGTLIQSSSRDDFERLMRRVAIEPAVARLVDAEYKRQDFNLLLDIQPARQGFYTVGEKLTFSLRPERASYLLLLNIDAGGYVTVLYPRSSRQAGRTAAQAIVTMADQNEVVAPTGTEFLKAFAFTDKPAWFDSLVAHDGGVTGFTPVDPLFGRLMDMIKDDLPGRSQTRLKLVTSLRKK